jgi:hypothetical protein
MLATAQTDYDAAVVSAQTRSAAMIQERIQNMNSVSSSLDNEIAARITAVASTQTHLALRDTNHNNDVTFYEGVAEGARHHRSSSAHDDQVELNNYLGQVSNASDAMVVSLQADLVSRKSDFDTLADARDADLYNLYLRKESNLTGLSGSADSVDATLAEILQVDNGEAVTNLVELVTFIDNIDGANDTAITDAIDTAEANLANQATARELGDTAVQDLIDFEQNLREDEVFNKDGEYTTMQADHLSRSGSMDTLMTSHFEGLTAYVNTTEANWTSGELLTEQDARSSEDNAISNRISTEEYNRIDELSDLTDERTTTDAALSARINALQTTLTVGQLTLSGLLDGASDVNIDGTLAVGSHAAVPVAYDEAQTPDQSVNNGKMFYLTNATATPGFEEGNKWYFCEDGQWHASTFMTDTDGDGYRDQVDYFPNDPSQHLAPPPA